MSKFVKVEGHNSLERDVYSNAIVNTNKSDYQTYMNRLKNREKHSDQIRNAVKEINTLKSELREIKNLIKGLGKN